MTAPLVFMDTYTTGLSLDDDIWEFAAIRREPDGTEIELHLFIEHDYNKCRELPESFREDHASRYLDHKAVTQLRAANAILDLFAVGDGGQKPHVVGAVPNFDTERIAAMCQRQGYKPSAWAWHYHLIDVENLAVGYLSRELGLMIAANDPDSDSLLKTITPPWHYHLIDVENLAVGWLAALPLGDPRRDALTLPWNSDDMSRAVGVDPDRFKRYTAMGDVRWAMAIYDAVMGGKR